MPIYEPGLEEIVKRNFASGRLQFSTNLGEAIQGSQVAFIAVEHLLVKMVLRI
jgi:UDPglucose 6-dehydrogenase